MDWIFDNLQILFVIAAGVAYWLNSMRQAKEEAEEEARGEPPVDLDEFIGREDENDSPPSRTTTSPQTEVFLPPPVPVNLPGDAPPPLTVQGAPPMARENREFPVGTPALTRPTRPPSRPRPDRPEVDSTELDRQLKLAERMDLLRTKRQNRSIGAAATQRSVEAQRAARKGLTSEIAPTSLDGIRERLRSPREVRRAIVLREILNTPLGLK